MFEIELWEAVCLSLNIEPEALQVWEGPVFEPFDHCPLEFKQRLSIALSHIGNSFGHWETKLKERSTVHLPEFAAWAVEANLPDLPPELVAMATGTQPAPAQDTATPAPVVAGASGDRQTVEPIEQRRARYLEWHTEESRIQKRGAVQRVFERERLQNPRVDRSAIGKDIAKAREAMKTQTRTGTMFNQLVRDGRRQR